MKSPQERYQNDPMYRQAVDWMENLVSQCDFTPSEMREMAVLACINFEMKYGLRHYRAVPVHINQALDEIREYVKKRQENESAQRGEKGGS